MFDTILFGIVIGIGSHLLIVTYTVVSNIKNAQAITMSLLDTIYINIGDFGMFSLVTT